jgi:hypothetical protein
MPDKPLEHYYLQALRTALPEVPPGEPVCPEPPDFVIPSHKGRLGIEFTEVHLPPQPGARPHQERQALKDRIVALAERTHNDLGGPALYVGIYFNEHVPLSKADIRPLARAIADSVLAAPMPRSISEPVELPWGMRPEATWGVEIHPSIDGKDKLSHADAGGWVADITTEHVGAVLQRKARTVSLARARCDELWLVLVNNPFSRAAPAEITTEALSASYEAAFDRLIWLLPHVPRAHTLEIARPAA